jgi:hypothetical protein
MKNLFILSEEEKNRILNLHESATKRHYLNEQLLDLGQSETQPTQPIIGPTLLDAQGTIVKQGLYGDPYVYAKYGNDYYFAKASEGENPNWKLAKTEKGIRDIKGKIFNEKLPKVKTIKPPVKQDGKTDNGKKLKPELNRTDVDSTSVGNSRDKRLPKIGDTNKTNDIKKTTNKGNARILKSLKDRGFTVDVNAGFEPGLGYFVSACKEHGCAKFTNNMLNQSLGDAWQAYSKVNTEINVSPSIVQQMTNLFNKMNKSGVIPKLDTKTPFDSEAKSIIKELIPSQSNFQNLTIGTVVGLYFPGSQNYDLAFFQSAIGKSRDSQGHLHDVISKPYFCKNPNDCSSTTWSESDLKKPVKFYPGKTLSSGKSFAPNTHLGAIGYVDSKGIPYIIHNVHQKVYAYPVNKLGNNNLSIVWAGKPI